MSLNTNLNAFLAILENRPEVARQVMGSLPRRVDTAEMSTIYGRIQQAGENLKCRGIKDAVRAIWNETLRLKYEEPLKEGFSQEEVDAWVDQEEAFLKGVQAVEEILGRVLKTCEETEKSLGPQAEVLPGR
jgi:hypothetical protein